MRPKAPEALRARVFGNLRADDAHHRHVRWGKFAALAAGVTVTVVVANMEYKGYQRRLYEQDAALRHARQFPLEIEQSPENIERWLEKGMPVREATINAMTEISGPIFAITLVLSSVPRGARVQARSLHKVR